MSKLKILNFIPNKNNISKTIDLIDSEKENIDEIYVLVKLKDGTHQFAHSTIDLKASLGGIELIKDEMLQQWRSKINQ